MHIQSTFPVGVRNALSRFPFEAAASNQTNILVYKSTHIPNEFRSKYQAHTRENRIY